MMTTTKTYEVNANGNRSYQSESAAKVADVAATWAKQGHEPKAYVIFGEDKIRIVNVPVTTKKATATALRQAA